MYMKNPVIKFNFTNIDFFLWPTRGMKTEDNQNTADTVNEWVRVNNKKKTMFVFVLFVILKGLGFEKQSQTHQT